MEYTYKMFAFTVLMMTEIEKQDLLDKDLL